MRWIRSLLPIAWATALAALAACSIPREREAVGQHGEGWTDAAARGRPTRLGEDTTVSEQLHVAPHPRAVVLVEGISDRNALEALAARRGRNLADEGVRVVAIGGAQAIARAVAAYAQRGIVLAGLCDAGEERDFRRGLERAGLATDLTR